MATENTANTDTQAAQTPTIVLPAGLTPPYTERDFFFRADKDGVKRDTVTVLVPQVTMDDVLSSLDDDDERVRNYAIDLINDALVTAARKQIDSSDTLNYAELTLEKLACAPKASRGNGIDAEVLKAFAEDYIKVHVALGKEPEKAEKAAAIFVKKLTPVKDDKQLLDIMQTLLATWFEATENGAQHAKVYEYLSDRISQLMKAEPQNLADFL